MADLEDAAAIDVYRQVCVEGALPDLSGWEDITKEVFQSRWKKLFRKALRKVKKIFRTLLRNLHKPAEKQDPQN